MKTGYAYIMSSHSRRLYIGVTSNLEKRVSEHKQGLIEGFTKIYKNKEPRRKQLGIKVAAVGSTADRHPADGGYQLHAASGGELDPKRLISLFITKIIPTC